MREKSIILPEHPLLVPNRLVMTNHDIHVLFRDFDVSVTTTPADHPLPVAPHPKRQLLD
jgi:hypothetical protein